MGFAKIFEPVVVETLFNRTTDNALAAVRGLAAVSKPCDIVGGHIEEEAVWNTEGMARGDLRFSGSKMYIYVSISFF